MAASIARAAYYYKGIDLPQILLKTLLEWVLDSLRGLWNYSTLLLDKW